MNLLHEDLARIRIAELLAEAESRRQARAVAREVREVRGVPRTNRPARPVLLRLALMFRRHQPITVVDRRHATMAGCHC